MPFIYDIIPTSLLWSVSKVLLAFVALAFAGLALYSIIVRKRDRNRASRKNDLRDKLLIHLETPLSEIGETFALRAADLELLSDLVQQLLRAFGGDTQARLLSFFQALKLDTWTISRAKRGPRHQRAAAIQLLGYLPEASERLEVLRDIVRRERAQHLKYVACESLSRFARQEDFQDVLTALAGINRLSSLKVSKIFRRFRVSAGAQFPGIAMSDARPLNLRLAAIDALSDTPHDSSHSLLEALCWSENERICSAAFLALHSSGRAVSPAVIELGAAHPAWQVRLETARCAEHATHLNADAMLRLLGDRHWLVSVQAAKTLFHFGAAGRKIVDMAAEQKDRTGRRASAFLAEYG